MENTNICLYCMQDNQGQAICPHCGKDANAPLPENHLQPGEILGGRFLVGRAASQDARGIVYTVLDTRKENVLRIREYFPRGFARRASRVSSKSTRVKKGIYTVAPGSFPGRSSPACSFSLPAMEAPFHIR